MRIHLIGICGTGMGALARLLKEDGHEVRGTDEHVYPPMSVQLAEAGIPVTEGFAPENLAWGPDVVVVGNVCSKDHPEVVAALARRCRLQSFPGMVEEVLLPGRLPLVVAGTHGKTTTASLLAWLLVVDGQDPSFLIGGVPLNLHRGAGLGKGRPFVLEGDEYDTAFFDKGSKFLHYRPARAIVTSLEFDHADIFADLEAVRAAFRAFVGTIPEDGLLVAHAGDPEVLALRRYARCPVVTYEVVRDTELEAEAHRSPADVRAVLSTRAGTRRTEFELFDRGRSLGMFSTQLVGRYNVANATAALTVALRTDADVERLRGAVARFRGVKRRQELVGVAQGVRIVEDFAHHPTAVRLTISAIRRRYPEKALHVCFEPRSATTRRNVFFEAYAASFDLASQVYLGPLFAPQKIPEAERLDTQALAAAIRERKVPCTAFDTVPSLATAVVGATAPGDTVLVLSSGSFEGLVEALLRGFGDPVTFATPADEVRVDTLLAAYGLDPVRRTGSVDTLIMRDADRIIGTVSLEVSGDQAALFGLAVEPSRRGEGLGWVLGDCVLRHAEAIGVTRVYLVAGQAADFFASKLGFRPAPLSEVDPEVARGANFPQLSRSPDAVCMVLPLLERRSEAS